MRPAQKRFVRLAYAVLVLAAGLAVALATQGDGRPFGVEVPALLPILLAVAGLVAGAVGAARRSGAVALAACALLVLAVVPAGSADPGPLGYALGLLFGLLLLAFGELVHMARRHDRAHAAVREGVAEGHLDRVGGEALKTLAGRALLASALAGLGVGLAFLLAALGPLRLREAVETRAHLGVAVASLALMGGLALFILLRGARAPRPDPVPQESAPDVNP